MRPVMNVGASDHSRLRAVVFVMIGVALAWLVLSRSLAAFLADAAPEAALWFDSGQPEALVNLADQALITARPVELQAGDQTQASEERTSSNNQRSFSRLETYFLNLTHAFSQFETIGRNLNINRPVAPDEASGVRMWAETAATNDPLNPRALQILGQLAEANGDDESTAKFLAAANNMSPREYYASYWLMSHSALKGDYKSAIRYADVLLRADPQTIDYVVPVLAQISEDKEGAPLLKAALAENPPWRREFLAKVSNSVTDARTPLDLLLALRTSPVPLAIEDTAPYLNLLIARKFYGLAYYTWLQFLSPEQLSRAGLLFNGSFETTPSGLPFDWTIIPGSGVTIDIVPRSEKSDKHALLIEFQYGRVDYHSVTELVMLPPGRYEFTGEYQGKLVGPRGMKWRVVCANGNMTNGGESQMLTGLMKNWSTVDFAFTVPDKDCPAQYVRLDLDARMASEQLISGSIYFDDLQILRVSTEANSEQNNNQTPLSTGTTR
jgi:tetratricopeptide (TPR) repeat protein